MIQIALYEWSSILPEERVCGKKASLEAKREVNYWAQCLHRSSTAAASLVLKLAVRVIAVTHQTCAERVRERGGERERLVE